MRGSHPVVQVQDKQQLSVLLLRFIRELQKREGESVCLVEWLELVTRVDLIKTWDGKFK